MGELAQDLPERARPGPFQIYGQRGLIPPGRTRYIPTHHRKPGRVLVRVLNILFENLEPVTGRGFGPGDGRHLGELLGQFGRVAGRSRGPQLCPWMVAFDIAPALGQGLGMR